MQKKCKKHDCEYRKTVEEQKQYIFLLLKFIEVNELGERLQTILPESRKWQELLSKKQNAPDAEAVTIHAPLTQ